MQFLYVIAIVAAFYPFWYVKLQEMHDIKAHQRAQEALQKAAAIQSARILYDRRIADLARKTAQQQAWRQAILLENEERAANALCAQRATAIWRRAASITG